MKGQAIKFDFKDLNIEEKLSWIKVIKAIFGFGLKEAKDIVDSNEYYHDLTQYDTLDINEYYKQIRLKIISKGDSNVRRQINRVTFFSREDVSSTIIEEIKKDVIKIGSVHIITEEEYESLKKSKDELKKQINMLNDIQDTLNKILIKHE